MRLFSFPPISSPQSQILILGTMPGAESLKQSQYYANSRNSFWKIMFALLNAPYSDDYSTKQNLLISNRIALWDVLKACEREGSLDQDIKKEEANDMKLFLGAHPGITQIYFNGQKAEKLFYKFNKDIGVRSGILPSTSPAHTMSFNSKLKEWLIIK